jgi:ADP-ribose pyrophosphatase
MSASSQDEIVFATPWFRLIARRVGEESSPYYVVQSADYVTMVPVTAGGELVLVRQHRPAVDRMTLEFPSGHLEDGETPEAAARRELLEETGYAAGTVEPLGCLFPDVGRLGNRLWCFFSRDLTPAGAPAEPGVETVLYRQPVGELLACDAFNHALNLAALLLAVGRGCLVLEK